VYEDRKPSLDLVVVVDMSSGKSSRLPGSQILTCLRRFDVELSRRLRVTEMLLGLGLTSEESEGLPMLLTSSFYKQTYTCSSLPRPLW
jgi:hypothetical protein